MCLTSQLDSTAASAGGGTRVGFPPISNRLEIVFRFPAEWKAEDSHYMAENRRNRLEPPLLRLDLSWISQQSRGMAVAVTVAVALRVVLAMWRRYTDNKKRSVPAEIVRLRFRCLSSTNDLAKYYRQSLRWKHQYDPDFPFTRLANAEVSLSPWAYQSLTPFHATPPWESTETISKLSHISSFRTPKQLTARLKNRVPQIKPPQDKKVSHCRTVRSLINASHWSLLLPDSKN